jgi:DNA-binding response OmpR family regulator
VSGARRSADAAAPGNETILLVEDEHGVRAFIDRALTRYGYRVLKADSAETALAMMADGASPSLLLTDVVLPHMSGPELAARIRQTHAGVAVLFMSGYSEQMAMGSGILEPGVHLLEKPFSANALLTRVREVLDAGGSPAA